MRGEKERNMQTYLLMSSCHITSSKGRWCWTFALKVWRIIDGKTFFQLKLWNHDSPRRAHFTIKDLIPEDILAQDDDLLDRRSIIFNMEGMNLNPVGSVGVLADI